MMISFIIIGRNEGWKLSKCLSGVKKFVDYNSIQKAEIIFVDSDSDDNSIEIAKAANVDIIFKISGDTNAAIARNIGAKTAKGEFLFFLDGDIELKPFALEAITNNENQLKYNYIVGFLDDVNYTNNWTFINQTPRSYKKEIKDQEVTTVGGGMFIIEKETWKEFDGMDEKLRRTQDRDLSLRMARKGKSGMRKSEVFGLHHTIPYKDQRRMWKMLFDGSIKYKGVFMRKHIFNRAYLPKLIREEWTLMALIISILLSVINPFLLLIYCIMAIVKIRKTITSYFFLNSFFHRILQDIIVFAAIIFFYPSKPNYKLSKIN